MKRIVLLTLLALTASVAFSQTLSFTNYSEKSMGDYFHTSGIRLAVGQASLHIQEKLNLQNKNFEGTTITSDFFWNSHDFATTVFSSLVWSYSNNSFGESSYVSPFVSFNQSFPVGKLSTSLTATYNFDQNGDYTGTDNDYYGFTFNYIFTW